MDIYIYIYIYMRFKMVRLDEVKFEFLDEEHDVSEAGSVCILMVWRNILSWVHYKEYI
jgi:hypothetical protein